MPQQRSPLITVAKGILVIVVLGVIGFGLWHWLGRPSGEELLDLGGDFADKFDFGDIWDQDPSLGSNATNSWENRGKGLELTLLNALDDTWQDEFVAAVADWDASPSLTLKTKQVTPESECTQQDDVMKVCNGNYGQTGWLGINEIFSTRQEGGTIISSVAKMNEYYLLNADRFERRYTMCHEIGHGFGMPHTDANFNNPDLGNCLDYTRTQENNLHPDESNFALLAELYGEFRRTLRRRAAGRHNRHLSPMMRELYYEAVAELEQEWIQDVANTTGASRKLGTKTYTKNLGGGYELQVRVLFANNE